MQSRTWVQAKGEGFTHTCRHTYIHMCMHVQICIYVQLHKHTKLTCLETHTPRQIYLTTCTYWRNIFHAVTSTVFLQLSWMINIYCEKPFYCQENMICCSLGNKCYASVDSHCHFTWLHHKYPCCNRQKETPRGKYIVILGIPQVDYRQV